MRDECGGPATCSADAGTRTPDPFITSVENLDAFSSFAGLLGSLSFSQMCSFAGRWGEGWGREWGPRTRKVRMKGFNLASHIGSMKLAREARRPVTRRDRQPPVGAARRLVTRAGHRNTAPTTTRLAYQALSALAAAKVHSPKRRHKHRPPSAPATPHSTRATDRHQSPAAKRTARLRPASPARTGQLHSRTGNSAAIRPVRML